MRSTTRAFGPVLLIALALGLLSACSGARRDNDLELTLYSYGSMIRWGEFESAYDMVDPKYREKHPLSVTDLERYKQIQVAGYRTGGPTPIEEGVVGQAVEIEVVNVHTQSPRSLVDKQIWRWDPEAKRWWLTTGLPDITRH